MRAGDPPPIALPVETLRPDEITGFDIYILEGKRYVLYRAKTLPLSTKDLERLARNDVETVYIPREQQARVLDYVEDVTNKILREKGPISRKVRAVYLASCHIMEAVMDGNLTTSKVAQVQRLAEKQKIVLTQNRKKAVLASIKLASHDYYTYSHSVHVSTYSLAAGQVLGLEDAKLLRLGEGALLHDYGKTLIPKEVLNKPGPLDDEEWKLIRRHPELGVEMLPEPAAAPPIVRYAIRDHHERVDGTGYPAGRKGGELSMAARIVAICDCFDAMTTRRVYQKRRPPLEALQIIGSLVGKAYDRDAYKALVTALTE